MIPIAEINVLEIAVGAVVGLIVATILQPRVEEAWFRLGSRLARGSTGTPSLTGIWRSRYDYPSADQPERRVSEHYVVFRESRGRVRGKSLTKLEASTLTLELWVEGAIATGIWRELTSTQRLYRGVLQLRIEEPRTRLTGAWLGFNRRNEFETGSWEFERVEREIGRLVRRKYRDSPDLA